jgi:hypothetical protein
LLRVIVVSYEGRDARRTGVEWPVSKPSPVDAKFPPQPVILREQIVAEIAMRDEQSP